MKSIRISLACIAFNLFSLTLFAQLTEEQQVILKEKTTNYTNLLQKLAANPDDSEVFLDLAENVFVSGAQVYDDLLEGNNLDEYMVYLSNIRAKNGQLKLRFDQFQYYALELNGNMCGVAKFRKIISSQGANTLQRENVLIFDFGNNKVLEIVKELPEDAKELVVKRTTQSKDLDWLEMVFVEGGELKYKDTNPTTQNPDKEIETEDYYISKYEITIEQFKRFIDATGYVTDMEVNGGGTTMSIENGAPKQGFESGVNWQSAADGSKRLESSFNYPVTNVSVNDAIEFCKWMSKETGQNYTLPTEAEWEYAARMGNKSRGYVYTSLKDPLDFDFESSSYDLEETAWLTANFQKMAKGPFPVGKKKPNELGIYDMIGNVNEWALDRDIEQIYLKGGSFQDYAYAPSFGGKYGSMADPGYTKQGAFLFGFRVVRRP